MLMLLRCYRCAVLAPLHLKVALLLGCWRCSVIKLLPCCSVRRYSASNVTLQMVGKQMQNCLPLFSGLLLKPKISINKPMGKCRQFCIFDKSNKAGRGSAEAPPTRKRQTPLKCKGKRCYFLTLWTPGCHGIFQVLGNSIARLNKT